jgi:hypothetical protein
VRPRRERLTAVAGALAVVLGTALAIWLLRPGPASRFDGGGGGLAHRQPRATWLVVLTIAAGLAFAWWAWHGRHRFRARRPQLLAAGLAVILVLAVVAGVLWPGGLLHRYHDPLDFSDFELDVPTTTAVPGTTAAGATNTPDPGGDATTVAPGTEPGTDVPTTGSP